MNVLNKTAAYSDIGIKGIAVRFIYFGLINNAVLQAGQYLENSFLKNQIHHNYINEINRYNIEGIQTAIPQNLLAKIETGTARGLQWCWFLVPEQVTGMFENLYTTPTSKRLHQK